MQSTEQPIVFVVDDDPTVCRGLARLFRSQGFHVDTFACANDFLARPPDDRPGCILLDVRMPGLSGTDLQAELIERNIRTPIVFLTGQGDIPMSVQAMKQGAVDFLIKPANRDALLSAVRQAIEKDLRQRARQTEIEAVRNKIRTLTPREREVLLLVVQGFLNKQIAAQLGIVEKTVKVHRARVMQKMRVASVADLVRAVGQADLVGPPAKPGGG